MLRPFLRLDSVSAVALAISSWTFVLAFLLRPDLLHWSIGVSFVCTLVAFSWWVKRARNGSPVDTTSIRLGSNDRRDATHLTPRDLVHARVTGTSGAGKTELLLNIADQEIRAGRGMVFVDGKGDVATFAKLAASISHHGRDDELTILDFVSGGSNRSIDPFHGLPGDMVASILCPEENDGKSLRAFCAACHDAGIARVPAAGRRHQEFTLGSIVEASRHGSEVAAEYLRSLTGYDPARGHDQRADILEDHARMSALLAERISRLFEIGGFAFDQTKPRVDLAELVSAGRIVIVFLPCRLRSAGSASMLDSVIELQLRRCSPRPGMKRNGLLILDAVDPSFVEQGLATIGYGIVEVSPDYERRSPSWAGCDILMQNQFDPELRRLRCGEAILVRNSGSEKFMIDMVRPGNPRLDMKAFIRGLPQPLILTETSK